MSESQQVEQARLGMAQMNIEKSAPKICKDCAHYRLNGTQPAGSQHRCNRPIVNLVTGQSAQHDEICEKERSDVANVAGAMCGPNGHFWEPRT